MRIVFANANATAAAIANAADAAEAEVEDNPNCFALAFNRAAHETVAGSDLPQPTLGANKYLTYTAPASAGTWKIGFSLGTQALTKTFSTADPAGAYTARITITDVQAPVYGG